MNIVLIGYRGSGKSSVGRIVAARLGREFVDTDEVIVREAGMTIREIFEREGEAGFRTREAAAVRAVAGRDGIVISAGGGAVLRAENVAALKRDGRVVWLKAPAEMLYARIQADGATNVTRPNLTAGGGLEEVRKVLAARVPLYEAAADVQLEVGALSVAEAAERVVALIEGVKPC